MNFPRKKGSKPKAKKVARRSAKRRPAKGAPRKRAPAEVQQAEGLDPAAFRSADPAPRPEPRPIDAAGAHGDTQSETPNADEYR